jgi:diguanylate cyclase (GGDEF)-like protein
LKLRSEPTLDEALEAVEEGRAFALVDLLTRVAYLLQDRYAREYRVVGRFERPVSLSIATDRNATVLQSILSKSLERIDRHSFERIRRQWIDLHLEGNGGLPYLKEIGIVLGTLLLASLFWGARLWRSQRRLRTLAITDPMTGLFNRHHFKALAPRFYERARKEDLPLSVILLDLDNFKAINDRHGHSVGDEVIAALARQLRTLVGKRGSVFRFGGEEFLIVLEGCSLACAEELAEKLREKTTRLRVPCEGGRTLRLSASFGVAELHPADRDLEATIVRADLALYRAKDGGRNRVECSFGPETPDAG